MVDLEKVSAVTLAAVRAARDDVSSSAVLEAGEGGVGERGGRGRGEGFK